MNLESLKRKRVKRMGVRISGHTGQRQIFLILDRATIKFQGDIGLWMQYIEFARKQRSNKKLSRILTSALRLHPMKTELWIYSAKYELEERGDIIKARSYMQRGLRFCKNSQNLWLEYAKLEMIYFTNFVRQERVLRTKGHYSLENVTPSDNMITADMVSLATITASESDKNLHLDDSFPQRDLEKVELEAAKIERIPIAIFGAAMEQFAHDLRMGERFFDTIAEFQGVADASSILQHIINYLVATAPLDPVTLWCFIRQPVVGIGPLSSEFPGALRVALARLNSTMQEKLALEGQPHMLHCRCIVAQRVIEWLAAFFVNDLDADIFKVLMNTLKKLWNCYLSDIKHDARNPGSFTKLLKILQGKGFHDLVNLSRSQALRLWPRDENVLMIFKTMA